MRPATDSLVRRVRARLDSLSATEQFAERAETYGQSPDAIALPSEVEAAGTPPVARAA